MFQHHTPQQSSSILDETFSHEENHIILYHSRGSTNSVNYPRPSMDGPNSQTRYRSGSRGAGTITLDANMASSPDARDFQHDELQRVQLHSKPHV